MQSSRLQIELISDFLWDFRQNTSSQIAVCSSQVDIIRFSLGYGVFKNCKIYMESDFWPFLTTSQSNREWRSYGRMDCFMHLPLRVFELVRPNLISLGLHFPFCFHLLTSAYALGPTLIMLRTSPLILTVVV